MNNLLALALAIGVIAITGYALVYVLPNGPYAKYLFYPSSQKQALRLAEHNGYNGETNTWTNITAENYWKSGQYDKLTSLYVN